MKIKNKIKKSLKKYKKTKLKSNDKKYIYKPALSITDRLLLIAKTKEFFEKKLCSSLNLSLIQSPIFLDPNTGLNDDLSGIEQKVGFNLGKSSGNEGKHLEVVQSLAKWKRWVLKQYNFAPDSGLVTRMCAIRADDEIDALHSIYVDQFDWEKIITKEERNVKFLHSVVEKISKAIVSTSEQIRKLNPKTPILSDKVFFITSDELLTLYPNKTPKEREYEIVKTHKTVFITGIGHVLDGSDTPHDVRAPDYDDWNLNGDLFFWHDGLNCPIEISSMGIRVDHVSISSQLNIASVSHRAKLPYHSAVVKSSLPLTIGGGIGQSRLCMLILGCKHVGEVQVGYWTDKEQQKCKKAGIILL